MTGAKRRRKIEKYPKMGVAGPPKIEKTRSAYWLELPAIGLHATCCSAIDSLVEYYRLSRLRVPCLIFPVKVGGQIVYTRKIVTSLGHRSSTTAANRFPL